MKTKIFLIATILLMISSLSKAIAKEMSAIQIVEKSEDQAKLAGSEAIAVLTIYDGKGNKRVRKTRQVTKLFDRGKTEKKLVKFMSPADVKGTGLLTFDYENKDDDMWLFMPALRKTRRIVSSEKSKSFMGSEFSYSDMTPPSTKDFHYKKLKEETVGGVKCWKIEMTPKNEDVEDENGFSKRISLIGQKDFVIRKSIYYDIDGELHKILTVKKIKLLDKKNKKYRPTNLEMVNKQNGRKSTMNIEKIQFSPKVKDSYFTTKYLEKK